MSKLNDILSPMRAALRQSAGPRRWQQAAADAHTVLTRPLAPTHFPRHLQIEIITHCNLACITCPRTVGLARAATPESRAEWFQAMPIDRYRRILDQIPGLRSLSLHGLGEPLMHPHIFEMVEEAAARHIAVRFTSNLTILTPERAERLVRSNLRRLIVSLDGATAATYEAIRVNASFEPVIANLAHLLETRRAAGGRGLRVDVNMVVCALNWHETPAMVRLCHKLGVDCLMLSPLEPADDDMVRLMCSPADWRRATTEARQEAARLGLRLYVRGGASPVRSPNSVPATNGANGSHATNGANGANSANPKETWRCLKPWTSTMIMGDGSVMPCCNIHDRRHALGNVMVEPFSRIWTGERYMAFREELKRAGHVPAPCTWCPDF